MDDAIFSIGIIGCIFAPAGWRNVLMVGIHSLTIFASIFSRTIQLRMVRIVMYVQKPKWNQNSVCN